MPRYEDEERIYHTGFRDGWRAAMMEASAHDPHAALVRPSPKPESRGYLRPVQKKRKPSAWNKFVKVNSKKKQFRYANGKVNLKKLGVAWRKKKRGFGLQGRSR